MGCDGGTIPRRDELVRIKKKPETKDKTSHQIFQWRYCNITQQLLQRPIVTCALGKLYNKTAIIEAILNKTTPSHIRTLRDIKELHLTSNPEFERHPQASPYICPISHLEMTGKYRFITLWQCGCVMAERTLKQIGGDVCPLCQTVFKPHDIVVLNVEDDAEIAVMLRRNEMRKKNAKMSSIQGVM